MKKYSKEEIKKLVFEAQKEATEDILKTHAEAKKQMREGADDILITLMPMQDVMTLSMLVTKIIEKLEGEKGGLKWKQMKY